jgi:hypothetical protein
MSLVHPHRRQLHAVNQFGSASAALRVGQTAAKELLPTTSNTLSGKLFSMLNKMPAGGSGKFNLSMEDWAARYLTIFGIYLPQGLFALWEDKHKWETNGRNALIWTMTLLLTIAVKSDRLSTNTLLNVFMKDKNTTDPGKLGFFSKWVQNMKLDGNYFDVLKKANVDFCPIKDVKRAHWANLDDNQLRKVIKLYDDLAAKVNLEPAEQKIKELIPKFLQRRNAFNLVSTGIITLLTMYLIGSLSMELVFRFIAPFDHDFEPDRFKNRGKRQAPASIPIPPVPAATLGMTYPAARQTPFQTFRMAGQQHQGTGGHS